MKQKNVNLEWNVLLTDFNKKDKVIEYNALSNELKDNIYKKISKKEIKSKQELTKYLNDEFMYNYWCRAEFEIMVGGLFSKDFEKIDIYQQLKMNLNHIVDYIISAMEIKFKE